MLQTIYNACFVGCSGERPGCKSTAAADQRNVAAVLPD